MIGDVGLIVGVYTFLRLFALLVPLTPEATGPGWQGIARVSTIIGMVLIAFALLDIIFSSSLASEFQAGFNGTSR